MAEILKISLKFNARDWLLAYDPQRPGRYPAHFPPKGISGVYIIADLATGQALYVGESHTNRLYETLIRHFSRWIDAGRPRETFDKRTVQVAWAQTEPQDALAYEALLIDRYRPTENTRYPQVIEAAEFDDSQIAERANAQSDEVPF